MFVKRKGVFLAVGLTAILLALASFYMSSPKATFETNRDITSVKSPIPNIKPAITHTDTANSYSHLPDHIQERIKAAESETLPESVSKVVNSSQRNSARMKLALEEMGQGATLEYLQTYIQDYSGFYNSRVVGENEDQRRAVRSAMKERLAIFLTSMGLDQARVEQLENLNYNVVEGGERSALLKGTVKDFIALSEGAKFSLNDQGKECLFFTSSNLKLYRQRVFGSGDTSSFGPYCAQGSGFGTDNNLLSDRIYDRNELEELIKELHE